MQLKPITKIVILFLVVTSLSVAGCSSNTTSNTKSTSTSTPEPAGLQADFLYEPAEYCVGERIDAKLVQFYDNSYGGDAPYNSYNITTWSWDFGDGNTSTQQNPVHSYPAIGNYTVVLTVTNDGGNTDTHQITMEGHWLDDTYFGYGWPSPTPIPINGNGIEISARDTSILNTYPRQRQNITVRITNHGPNGFDYLNNITFYNTSSSKEVTPLNRSICFGRASTNISTVVTAGSIESVLLPGGDIGVNYVFEGWLNLYTLQYYDGQDYKNITIKEFRSDRFEALR